VTRTVLPQAFNWSVFVVALTLMAAPVAQLAWRSLVDSTAGAPPFRG
jgi:hypothetical protein